MLRLTFDGAGLSRPGHASTRQVNAWADDSGEVFARAFAADDARWIDWKGLGTFHFNDATRDVHVSPATGSSPDVIQRMFDRVVQPVILQTKGWQALHASAVSGPHGALIFCGQGRSGKSTLAYALGQQPGFRQLSDDAVVIRASTAAVQLCPLPFQPSLRRASAEFFRTSPHGQAHTGWTESPTPPLPVHAVFVLAQDASAPTRPIVERVAPAEAFSVLLTHAHCFDESDAAATRQMVQAYLLVADAVRVHRVTYRPDFAHLSELLACVSGDSLLPTDTQLRHAAGALYVPQ
ncbi:MAG: hypothetical protein ABI051_02660 [Vicinamibacterales bacterium]